MAKRKRATKAEKNSKKPKSTKEEAVQDKPQENNIKNATGATTKDKTTATKCSTAYKVSLMSTPLLFFFVETLLLFFSIFIYL